MTGEQDFSDFKEKFEDHIKNTVYRFRNELDGLRTRISNDEKYTHRMHSNFNNLKEEYTDKIGYPDNASDDANDAVHMIDNHIDDEYKIIRAEIDEMRKQIADLTQFKHKYLEIFASYGKLHQRVENLESKFEEKVRVKR
jgi:predicted  nucleic acid-binding Zn-ribbon protein